MELGPSRISYSGFYKQKWMQLPVFQVDLPIDKMLTAAYSILKIEAEVILSFRNYVLIFFFC